MLLESPLTLDECQFCNLVSQNNGEDPLGSAGCYDQWLMMELPQPWEAKFWTSREELKPFVSLMSELISQGKLNKFRPLAIAPDKIYSEKGLTRVIYYYRPGELFTNLEKREYLLPLNKINDLAISLITSSNLDEFETYRKNSDNIREILVCTHGNVDVACSRFGYPIYEKLRKEYSDENLRVWRCSHIGGHRFAPTLIDFPSGRYWGHLNLEILETLINSPEDINKLRPYYRGWSGVSYLEQIFEAKLWQEIGKKWLTYPKTGRVIAQEKVENEEEEEPNWAEIEISYLELETQKVITRQGKLEAKKEILTLAKSGNNELFPVKQYQLNVNF
ncbi:sucrase ferredoxin [Cyanobacterium aponinum]|uniref:sucrase ferredoxin n=1 Tax=Cyanobacterium aponinum TaxID=379064 RepID=UPI000C12C2AC|nr:sucrase ferredoxin [Cyanobacterium aponinum]PHV62043.1 sucrase ferredoxin [Cyanobacterium aponinum IPPAS B-1201]